MEPNAQTKPTSKPTPSYRFLFKIVDDEAGETLLRASTYINELELENVGTSESVDMEVGAALRDFQKTIRPKYEEENYPTEQQLKEREND